MNCVFLLGNGFDLNFGLKSSCRDVLRNYRLSPSFNHSIKFFDSDYETWGDFELALIKYLPLFNNEAEACSESGKFNKYLRDYLIAQEISIKPKINSDEVLIKQKLSFLFNNFWNNQQYRDIEQLTAYYEKHSWQQRISIISFNYTTFMDDMLLETADSLSTLPYSEHNELLHIHGTTDRGIVIGADSLKQLCKYNCSFSTVTKREFEKTHLISKYDSSIMGKTKKIIESADWICTFGLSLGATDLKWKNMIVNWLWSNCNHRMFIYEYDYNSCVELSKDEILKKGNDLKSKWLTDCSYKASTIFDRIYVDFRKDDIILYDND